MSTKNNIPEVHNTVKVSAVEERTSDKKNIKNHRILQKLTWDGIGELL